jgi:tetratricopeptide (TPR) repeat protein
MKSTAISQDLGRELRRKTETPQIQISKPESPSQQWLLGLLLVAALFIAYQPAWHAGFIWDDDNHLTNNPCIVGPLGFKDIWTSSEAMYFPLVLTSFWVLHAIWGLDPLPYHLINIAMHAACAVLLWHVLRRLNVPGAWLGAALWALHPAQVESVAWISELKNTQSGLFFLMAILFFLRWHETTAAAQARKPAARSNRAMAPTGKGNEWDYALALFCAILALLSKPSTVMLPVALLLCWWWRERRWPWHNLVRLLPFFFLSAAVSAWAIWEQKYHAGALGPAWAQSWPERALIAGKVIWFYLGKLIWPQPLMFIYPRWVIDVSHPAAWLPTLAAVAALLLLWWYRDRLMWPLFFAFDYFVILLFPVLGFFNVYFFRYSFVGDHFQYLASMGPLALAGSGVVAAFELLKKHQVALRTAAYGVILVGLGTLTWQQTRAYGNAETLYRTTIANNPNCWMCYNNLGTLLAQTGQRQAAAQQFQQALRIKPDHAEAYYNLGIISAGYGKLDEAVERYRQALQINPRYTEAHNNLGSALVGLGRLDEGIEQYRQALRIDPGHAKAHNNLGTALAAAGKFDEAVDQFREALKVNPRYADAHLNRGLALSRQEKQEEAIQDFREALRIQPGYAAAHEALARSLIALGRKDEAVSHLQESIRVLRSQRESPTNR